MVTVAGAKVKLSMTISCTGPLDSSAGSAAAFIAGASSIFCVQPTSTAAGANSRNRTIVFNIEWRMLDPLGTTVMQTLQGPIRLGLPKYSQRKFLAELCRQVSNLTENKASWKLAAT